MGMALAGSACSFFMLSDTFSPAMMVRHPIVKPSNQVLT
jgi:hypothetical protein